jgi:hypothetical protein
MGAAPVVASVADALDSISVIIALKYTMVEGILGADFLFPSLTGIGMYDATDQLFSTELRYAGREHVGLQTHKSSECTRTSLG